METVEQVIANIRSRNIELSIKDGDRIVASRPLLAVEEEALKEIAPRRLHSSRRARPRRLRPLTSEARRTDT